MKLIFLVNKITQEIKINDLEIQGKLCLENQSLFEAQLDKLRKDILLKPSHIDEIESEIISTEDKIVLCKSEYKFLTERINSLRYHLELFIQNTQHTSDN